MRAGPIQCSTVRGSTPTEPRNSTQTQSNIYYPGLCIEVGNAAPSQIFSLPLQTIGYLCLKRYQRSIESRYASETKTRFIYIQ